MSLRSWVSVLSAVGAIVLLVVGFFTFSSFTAATTAGNLALNKLSPAAQQSARLNVGIASMERGVSSYLRTQESVSLAPYAEGANASGAAIEGMRVSLAGVEERLESRVEQVAIAREAWMAEVADPVIALVRKGQVNRAEQRYSTATSQYSYELMRSQAAALDVAVDDQLNDQFTKLRDFANVLGLALAFSALALIVGLITTLVLVRTAVLNPLDQLRRQLRDVAVRGHRESPIVPQGPPEFRAAGADAEHMRVQLVAQIDEASRAYESLATEAPDISAMRAELVRPSRVYAPGLDIFGDQQSAQGVLAGDWWDVVALPDGRSALIVTDISGHGPAAGFAGIRLKLSLTGVLSAGGSALEAIKRGCKLFEDYDSLFATVVIVVLDPMGKSVEWVNAGHPEPMILNPDGLRHSLLVTGPLLSTLGGNWQSATTTLADDELIVAWTDGITESHDATGDQLEEDGLLALIEQARQERITQPAKLVPQVLAAARNRSTDWDRDDVTLVIAALQ